MRCDLVLTTALILDGSVLEITGLARHTFLREVLMVVVVVIVVPTPTSALLFLADYLLVPILG